MIIESGIGTGQPLLLLDADEDIQKEYEEVKLFLLRLLFVVR